jgi:serine protease Do
MLSNQPFPYQVVGDPYGVPIEEFRAKSHTHAYMDIASYDKPTIDTVKKVAPCVVSVVVSKYLPRLRDISPADLFNPFVMGDVEDGAGQKVKVGGGSGFIVDSGGLVLTNKHVVFDEQAEYTVVLNDGTEHQATVLSRDPVNDIAVLKIGAKGLPHLQLASSQNIQLGQTVIAIGNALGLFTNSVSKGIISGLARSISASLGGSPEALTENLRGVIQTDVAINQGNSGGPLVDLNGNVVGINTAVIFGAQNIGFAIPIDWAKSDLHDIKEHGRIVKPYLGLMYVMLTPAIAKQYGLAAEQGAIVIRDPRPGAKAVLKDSPAQKAGLQEHDIIIKVNDTTLDEKTDLMDTLQQYEVGESVGLTYLRDGKERTCEVTLEERK